MKKSAVAVFASRSHVPDNASANRETVSSHVHRRWSTLLQHREPPVRPPETGKIAVKVINHYGDEVLKVCDAAAAVDA